MKADDLAEEYRRALLEYLDGAGEASLERAYDLGRRALASGLGVMEMAALQNRILVQLVALRHRDDKCTSTIEAAQHFFAESLSSFEMAHRGFQEVAATLRRLNERSNEKLEEMARHIATALHDEAWQLIAAVSIDLDLANRNLPPASRRHVQRVKNSLQDLEQNLRRLSHEIRPKILDDLGVVAAIRFLAEGISKRTGIPIIVSSERNQRFPSPVETGIYRVAQEALINLSRHSAATRARVVIQSTAGEVTLQVSDNGAGFDLQEVLTKKGHSGLGLLGIQERVSALGGMLQIDTASKKGTLLSATFPLARQEKHSELDQRGLKPLRT